MSKFNIFTWVITILSLLGVWLNIRKDKRCFIIWGLTNFSWAMVDFYKGLTAQAVLFSIYFLLAIYGLWQWRREERRLGL